MQTELKLDAFSTRFLPFFAPRGRENGNIELTILHGFAVCFVGQVLICSFESVGLQQWHESSLPRVFAPRVWENGNRELMVHHGFAVCFVGQVLICSFESVGLQW